MKNIEIQMQSVTGSWMTVHSFMMNETQSNYLQIQMKIASQLYPDKRIRAINSNGQILDIMG
jgi:hypothetical protein